MISKKSFKNLPSMRKTTKRVFKVPQKPKVGCKKQKFLQLKPDTVENKKINLLRMVISNKKVTF